jgi:beta-galactosidase
MPDQSIAAALPYFEDPAPGSGRRTPRADFRSDATVLSLNGRWRFRLSPTAAGTGAGFADPALDDSRWDEIAVPSHWVLEPPVGRAGAAADLGIARGITNSSNAGEQGHWPIYTNTAFPIPIDPPRMPDQNPTGDYRLRFFLPGDWAGERSVLRFQGVDSCGKVWLNGVEIGHSKGSRLVVEYDVTDALHPGENVLAVRVHRWSSGTYLEDQDMWWLPGIFRDVELLARPAGAVDDFFVHADYDHTSGTGTLRVDADVPGVVDVPELGIRIPAGETVRVPVDPWSAEIPRLYAATLTAAGETIALRIGFRTVAIVDGRFIVNGAPVLFRGVNRHEHDPDRGRTLARETMIRDIVLMKQHNINAVRTSHYPPHPEFLRLCDEYGLWVVEECDLESHGFIYAGWEGNPPAEPEWRDAMLDRLQRMVERDKNSPSVVVWSLANESWTGDNFGVLQRWLRDRDPGRPIHYERDPSYRDSDFSSLMYPSLPDLEAIGRREEPRPEGVTDEEDERRRALPFLLCEFGHAMGNGPGSLRDYVDILERYDRFCGGFIWEWIDHGFTARTSDGGTIFAHGGDIDFRPNGARYCLDGLVTSDRTPSPGLIEYAKVIQPVRITIGDSITLRSTYDLRDTAHLDFSWTIEVDGVRIASGRLDVPPIVARESMTVPLPREATADAAGETWLTVSGRLREATLWADAGTELIWGQGQIDAAPAVPAETPLSAHRSGSAPVRFDDRGHLHSLFGMNLDAPVLDVWRAPIENDRGQGGRNDVVSMWKATGIDRLMHRVLSVEESGRGLRTRVRSAPATQPFALISEWAWSWDDETVTLRLAITPEGPWEDTPYGHHPLTLPRLGIRLGLPGDFSDATWFGPGPGEAYVDSREAARIGRWSRAIDDLQFPYEVPEENGNRIDARWLELRGAGLPGLRVEGAPVFDFTARRWTSEALEYARHPKDLADSGRVWLNLDLGQRGIGSAACGPALPDRYALEPEGRTLEILFRRTGHA